MKKAINKIQNFPTSPLDKREVRVAYIFEKTDKIYAGQLLKKPPMVM